MKDILSNENYIKALVINNYAQKNSKSFYVCNELTISDERKIVDLVFCKDNYTYAYEIKALKDDTRRLQDQLMVYCKIFDYVYVVVTPNHLSKLSQIPVNVGIVVIGNNDSIVYKQKATRNNHLEKEQILQSMSLQYIRSNSECKKYKRTDCSCFSYRDARKLFIKHLQLKSRWSNKDLASNLHHEDITINTQYIRL